MTLIRGSQLAGKFLIRVPKAYQQIPRTCRRTLLPLQATHSIRWQSTISVVDPQSTKATSITKSEEENEDDIEKTTGIIEQQSPQEVLMYFDRVYPMLFRLWWLRDAANFLLMRRKIEVVKLIKDTYITPGLNVSVAKVVPREKDGGVFVTFRATEPSVIVSDVVEKISETAKKNSQQWNLLSASHYIRAFPVKGTPWIEDLRRTSTNRLKVEFEGSELSQETLYLLFRRYGPIMDIIPVDPSQKDGRKFAVVIFTRLSNAATARNCVNGVQIKDTKLHLFFQPLDHSKAWYRWIFDHPRISLPLFLAILAGLAVIIFEPIRMFFIRKKICGHMEFERIAAIRWIQQGYRKLRQLIEGSIGFGFGYGKTDSSGRTHFNGNFVVEGREKESRTLTQWINEGVNTFIVVHGPRGSGKESLVMEHALKNRKNVYSIDCESLTKARNDSSFIRTASRELGYAPVFPWMNNFSTFLDTIAQGLTGQKTGLSESAETQFKNMLTTAGNAITKTALENKKKILQAAATQTDDSDNSIVGLGGSSGGISGDNSDTSDSSSSTIMSDESYLQLHPQERPVVVLKHFLGRSEHKPWVYKQLAEWAASLIQANVAHVIFITSDVAYENVLAQQLPNQIYKQLNVGDANMDACRSFVEAQLEEQKKISDTTNIEEEKVTQGLNLDLINSELSRALKPLGGRMSDLQSFVRRLKSGEQPVDAVLDMIEQSSNEIYQMYIMRGSDQWSKEQAWTIIKLLAGLTPLTNNSKKQSTREQLLEINPKASLPLGVLIQDSNFKTLEQQKAIAALEHAELIVTHTDSGRLMEIKAGKPIYQAAFAALVNDQRVSSYLDTFLLESSLKKEESKIDNYERELSTLHPMSKKWEIRQRFDYVSALLLESQVKVEKIEKQLEEKKKTILSSRK